MSGTIHPLDELLGIRYEERHAARVVTALSVTPRLLQSAGILHGGVLAALVESAVGAGAALNAGEGRTATGVQNQVHFLRAAVAGVVRACAAPVHRGRTPQLWTAEVFDEQDRLEACGTVHLLNVEDRAATPVPGRGRP